MHIHKANYTYIESRYLKTRKQTTLHRTTFYHHSGKVYKLSKENETLFWQTVQNNIHIIDMYTQGKPDKICNLHIYHK